MDFAYTPRLVELKRRAAGADGADHGPTRTPARLHGGLPADAHAAIRAAVLETGLQAINMPEEWGGAGLSVLEQVVVQEELGKLTGALWDCVWRPANALRACTPAQRERYLLPGHPRRAARRGGDHGGARGLGPAGDRHDRDARGRRLPDRRREVVRHRGRRRGLPARARPCGAGRRADDVPRRQGSARRPDRAGAPLHAHVRLRAPGVRLRGRARRRRRGARRGRRRLRAHPRLVHGGAADDRRPHDRRRRPRAQPRRRVGEGADAGRRAPDRPPDDPGHAGRLAPRRSPRTGR